MTEWQELCDVLAHHAKRGASCEETLVRLFHKALATLKIDERPSIECSDLKIRREERERASLESLLTDHHRTDKMPAMEGKAVVVVEWGGREFLIDGRRRINHWLRTKSTGAHPVLVVSTQ